MQASRDIAVLAQRAYLLSILTKDEMDARYVEAKIVVEAIRQAATPAAVVAMMANVESRWGDAFTKAGVIERQHPFWYLGGSTPKSPPAIQIALESAFTNPARTLKSRLATIQLIPEAERAALHELPRALAGDAFANATDAARNEYIDMVRHVGGPHWMKTPWITVTPFDKAPPPVSILINGQKPPGVDPLDELLTSWDDAIRSWDVTWLRDNPLAKLYQAAEDGVVAVFGSGKELVKVLLWLGAGYLAVETVKAVSSRRQRQNA